MNRVGVLMGVFLTASLVATAASWQLTVALYPTPVVQLGAQWKVDSGVWQNSGATVTIGSGQHTLSFKTVLGYVTPSAQSFTLNPGDPLDPLVLRITYLINAPPPPTARVIGFNYQGRLTKADGQPWEKGKATHNLYFRIWNDPTSIVEPACLVWAERQTNVPVEDGCFNVMLGGGQAIGSANHKLMLAFAHLEQYVGIAVDSADVKEEIKPRQRLLNTPHSLNGVPAGTITAFAGEPVNVPPGWLLCDGRTLDGTQYPALFAAIGKAWGGSAERNVGQFKLPDLRGRFLRGVDLDAARDPDAATRVPQEPNPWPDGGPLVKLDDVGTYQSNRTRRPNTRFVFDSQGKHTHQIRINSADEGAQTTLNYQGTLDEAGTYLSDRVDAAGGHSHTISSTQGAFDQETRPFNAAVNWIIKY